MICFFSYGFFLNLNLISLNQNLEQLKAIDIVEHFIVPQKAMSQKPQMYRPLITSLTFNNQNIYLPFRFNFTITQIQQIKKYLPKNLFKLHGVDAESQSFTKEDEETLQKAKLKIKAVKGVSTETRKPIDFRPKQQVRMIEWYNKTIYLRIPYSSKLSQPLVDEQVNTYIDYYLEHFMLFKNTLTEEIYCSDQSLTKKLTAEQVSTETDVIFGNWNIEPEVSDDSVKVIRINVPILLCLNFNETYQLSYLKQHLKTDIIASTAILLKHSFNTRVTFVGSNEKQFISLNSFCNQQNALKEEQKLRAIIGQQKIQIIETEETKLAAKKDHKFLILVLTSLILIYFCLKLFPIHGVDENKYLKPQQMQFQGENVNFQDQQLF